MPHKLDWKYEYWEGKAHISPRMAAIATTAVAIEPRAVPASASYLIQPVCEADSPFLRPAYSAAFADAVDYCDYPLEHITDAAERNLRTFFAGDRGKALPFSQMALAWKDRQPACVGAALVVEKKNGIPLIDLLFVVPEWQGKGVATALVSTAMNALHAAGYPTLKSRYLLSNEPSRNWHLRFGFVEEMDSFLLSNYYDHAWHEWQRHQTLNDLSVEELDQLARTRDEWEARLEEARAQERENREEILLSVGG